MKYSTIQLITVQFSTAWHNAVQHSTMPSSSVQVREIEIVIVPRTHVFQTLCALRDCMKGFVLGQLYSRDT